MLNVRDTIIAAKRRCLYLAVALAINEEQQKRLDGAEEWHKESVGLGMVDQKARVWTECQFGDRTPQGR